MPATSRVASRLFSARASDSTRLALCPSEPSAGSASIGCVRKLNPSKCWYSLPVSGVCDRVVGEPSSLFRGGAVRGDCGGRACGTWDIPLEGCDRAAAPRVILRVGADGADSAGATRGTAGIPPRRCDGAVGAITGVALRDFFRFGAVGGDRGGATTSGISLGRCGGAARGESGISPRVDAICTDCGGATCGSSGIPLGLCSGAAGGASGVAARFLFR
mmetsp:Transcript_24516/g.61222  ORF Transcript_24516/g.61222 Transcript_24516/m.61222 type:complete len:218 (-) Transcript_24516:970-1623(-)